MSQYFVSITDHEYDCDKCCGSGKILDGRTFMLIKQWRSSLGLSASTVATELSIPYTSYCKFENGSVRFSEARQRIILKALHALSLRGSLWIDSKE